MKAKLILLASVVFIILVLQGVLGANIEANYQVFGDKTLVEINFADAKNLELKMPYDAAALELNVEDYNVDDFSSYKVLSVPSARNLSVKFITSAFVEVSGNKRFFVLPIKFDAPADITLFLPEKAVLTEDKLILPKPDEISTDGRRIIISWGAFTGESVLVEYEKEAANGIYFVFIGLLVILAAALAWRLIKEGRHKKKITGIGKSKAKHEKRSELTINLFGEEKKIVEYLLVKKDRESWTKEISRELEIPKVRLSRKLRALEQKGLIKRTPYGNENRIKLLRR
jgi:uncharacterized membrane protein